MKSFLQPFIIVIYCVSFDVFCIKLYQYIEEILYVMQPRPKEGEVLVKVNATGVTPNEIN
jgi:hypothetical protein